MRVWQGLLSLCNDGVGRDLNDCWYSDIDSVCLWYVYGEVSWYDDCDGVWWTYA